LTRQLNKQQGGSSSNTNNWYANQYARREQEADRTLRERRLVQDRIDTEMQDFEAKAVNKRYIREQARADHDRAMEEGIIKAQCEKKLAAEARGQEERLAMELERLKLEKTRDEKMRQQIRYKKKEIFIKFFNITSILVKQALNYVI